MLYRQRHRAVTLYTYILYDFPSANKTEQVPILAYAIPQSMQDGHISFWVKGQYHVVVILN